MLVICLYTFTTINAYADIDIIDNMTSSGISFIPVYIEYS